MSDAVFRSAQTEAPAETPVEPASGPVETSGKEVSVPDLFVSYEEDQGKPYVAHYFDLDTTWDREPSMKRDLSEIDGYLKEQVKHGKLANTTKAASQFIKEMERAAGLSRYETTNNRISKILAYIDFKRVVNG
jgi:hypothetical protein